MKTQNLFDEAVEKLHPMDVIVGPSAIVTTTVAADLLEESLLVTRIPHEGIQSPGEQR
jgi:16S rRNA C1402 (ribose-2'-O) methylase RsmI